MPPASTDELTKKTYCRCDEWHMVSFDPPEQPTQIVLLSIRPNKASFDVGAKDESHADQRLIFLGRLKPRWQVGPFNFQNTAHHTMSTTENVIALAKIFT